MRKLVLALVVLAAPVWPQQSNLDLKISRPELENWLRLHGVAVGPFETRYGAGGFGPSIYIDDPDGNTVELRIGISEECH